MKNLVFSRNEHSIGVQMEILEHYKKERQSRMVLIIGGAYQGKTAYAREQFDETYEIIDAYHLKVREQIEAGLNPIEEAGQLLKDKQDLVIISDEIGYGLVPVEAFERIYREMSGRVNCYFAGKAEQVIRVVCGIGTRIK